MRLSYDSLDRESNCLARGLLRLGVKKGDRVAVSLGNNIEYATVGIGVSDLATQSLLFDNFPRRYTHCLSSVWSLYVKCLQHYII